jgi:flagellar hook-associated protein 1 FlgK
MAGISQILETARRAMLAQQYNLAVTGHNIANAGTAGYSRQRAELVTAGALSTQAGLLGTGVMVQSVSRLHDNFIDQQIRACSSSLGTASADYRILSQIEAMFNEPSDSSLSSVMGEFFSAWQGLSTSPEDPVSRSAVMAEGKNVAAAFHRLNNELTTLRSSQRDDLNSRIDQINTLTGDISTLNSKISAAIAGGQSPNDLQDLRDTKLEALAALADIQVSDDGRGSKVVSLGGTVIADNGAAIQLRLGQGTAATISGSTFDQLRIVTAQGQEVRFSGGEAGAILTSYNSTIPDALGRLDRMAEALVSEVNSHHATGYGTQHPPQTGINFFMGTSAATIALDLTDTSGGAAAGSAPSMDNIAASSLASAAGNNAIALLIAGTFGRTGITGSGGTTLLEGMSLSQYYNVTVTRIASSLNAAASQEESQDLVMTQLSEQRDAVSGVSLDEEMTNLIKFQRAFDAAAQLVSTVDEMFESILNMV